MSNPPLAALLVAGLLGVIPGSAAQAAEAGVTRYAREGVFLRYGPGDRYRSSGYLARGDQVMVVERLPRWSRVWSGESGTAQMGWVERAHLVRTQPLPRSRAGLYRLPLRAPGLKRIGRIDLGWGTASLVHGLLRAARVWARASRRTRTRSLRVKTLGQRDGGGRGLFDRHKGGRMVDLEPIERRGRYDRAGTARMIRLLRRHLRVKKIRGDPRIPGLSRRRPFNWGEVHVEVR